MSNIEEIRQQQTSEFSAKHSPKQRLVQIISNLIHPLLTLTYSALVVCSFTPMMILPFSLKAFFVGEVAFYTLIMPALTITLMHVFHIIGHWALRDRRDRTIPFLTNCICYAINAYVLTSNEFLPSWVLFPYYGSVILTFVAWVVSFWWKISAHASANAAAATYFLILYTIFPDIMPFSLCQITIILVGIVCSTRVYLGRHTLPQIGAGVLLGICSMVVAELLFL